MEVNVNMKPEYIYDLLLFHTYSKFSGFLINVLGLAVIITGGLLLSQDHIGVGQALIYVLAGISFIAYTPLTLKKRAKDMMKAPCHQSEIEYKFDETGIRQRVLGKSIYYSWKDVEKAISTPKDIVFYVEEEKALILPKISFGEKFIPIMELIFKNLTRDKIYIR